jgi:hypothetical protein
LLTDSGLGSIFIFYSTIAERRGHGNTSTREIRIVIQAGHHGFSGRGLNISRQETKEVVLSRMTGLDHETKIRRKGAIVGKTTNSIVGIRAWKWIGQLSWPLKHFSLIVGSIDDIGIRSHSLELFLSMCDALQFTPTNAFNGVASSTDLTIDLKSATKGTAIVRGKHSQMRPRKFWWMNSVFRKKGYCHCGSSSSRSSRCGISIASQLSMKKVTCEIPSAQKKGVKIRH